MKIKILKDVFHQLYKCTWFESSLTRQISIRQCFWVLVLHQKCIPKQLWRRSGRRPGSTYRQTGPVSPVLMTQCRQSLFPCTLCSPLAQTDTGGHPGLHCLHLFTFFVFFIPCFLVYFVLVSTNRHRGHPGRARQPKGIETGKGARINFLTLCWAKSLAWILANIQ